MAEDRPNILCTKVDMHAGNWPISSFVGLFRVAKRCVESALKDRPEIIEVWIQLVYHVVLFFFLCNCWNYQYSGTSLIQNGTLFFWGGGGGVMNILVSINWKLQSASH